MEQTNNEKEYHIPLTEHEAAVRLSGDENPIHKFQNIMMGAHLLSLIEVHPEIKNHYIQNLEVRFDGSVIMNAEGNRLISEIKKDDKIVSEIKKKSEPGTFVYTVTIKENNNLVLRGMLHTTDSYERFKMESRKNLDEQLQKGIDSTKIADLHITDEKIKEYYRLIYSKSLTEEEYKNKYKGLVPSPITAFFIPAEIIRMLKSYVGEDLNNGKKYLYASQTLEFYAPTVSNEGLQIIGKKPENLGTKSRCHIDLFVSGLEGIIAKSRTLAMAY
jgi:transposase-like protein